MVWFVYVETKKNFVEVEDNKEVKKDTGENPGETRERVGVKSP